MTDNAIKKAIRLAPSRSSAGPPLLQKYAFTFGSVFIAFGIRVILTPHLAQDLPFMVLIAAVLVSAWYGGASMGFLALVLGFLLTDYFFLTPRGSLWLSEPVEIFRCIRYVFTGSVGIAVIELLHRSRRRTQAALDELREEIIRRTRSEKALLEARAQLARHADELEQRVIERTVKLTASVQSLERMLYHIAHNLRAPLRAMEGYSSLLREQYGEKLDETARDFSTRICEAATQMDRLIQALLEYGRLGHVDVPLTNLDLDQQLRQAVLELGFRTAEAEINIKGSLPQIRANPKVLQRILTSLLENALKFVAPGIKPRIQIWAEARGELVRVYIQDNGIGIEPRHHDRIFNPFERLHSRSIYEGIGIGLAIVREGMHRMHGNVGVESALGQGSRFWLEFQSAQGNYQIDKVVGVSSLSMRGVAKAYLAALGDGL